MSFPENVTLLATVEPDTTAPIGLAQILQLGATILTVPHLPLLGVNIEST
jgi:hypothetical protein